MYQKGIAKVSLWDWREFGEKRNNYKLCTQNELIVEGSLNSKLPTIWRVEKQMKSR